MTTQPPLLDRPVLVPNDLRDAARDKGWPDGLLDRACELRVARRDITRWLTHDRPTLDEIGRFLDHRARLMFGTLRAREATWGDDEALADLFANAPEEIGEWQVTVERSPYPFAQFRLQEHPYMHVIEDRGVILATMAHAVRNTHVAGRRISVRVTSAARVRQDCRGQGLTHLVQMNGGPGCAWYGAGQYYYIRSQNFGASNWIKAINPDALASAPTREGDVPGLPVTVFNYPRRPYTGDPAGIRMARRGDLRRCVALINRTHRGLDLFRPYTVAFLEERLDDPCWGPLPDWWTRVYGWSDYHVLEEDGRIVACAGLWDRGRNMREVWRHKMGGQHTVAGTALLDFGYAEGREDGMARLIGYLIGETDRLGRDRLMAPLEQLPALAERLAGLDPEPETRGLIWRTFGVDGRPTPAPDPDITRPHTDLAYW